MNYSVIVLEILTALLGLILLVSSLVLPKKAEKGAGYFGAVCILIILALSFFLDAGKGNTFFHGLYVLDSLALYFKQIFMISAVLVMVMSIGYLDNFQESKLEYLALLVFALLGMMVMVSANDFITVYIGLELMTITFVVLTAFNKRSVKSQEAGLKYILLSAISSGILLYGMSIIYGVSGSETFTDVAKYLNGGYGNPLVVLAVIFLIAGFGFKISMVPFHMWSPDIYEGAPTPITAFLAIGSKAAGFAVLIRLFYQVMPGAYSAAAVVISILAALTMIVGNLIAIPQNNIKRLLAYSSIAHAGYILVGIIAFSRDGISAMLFYLLLYIFANAGAFSAIIAFSNKANTENIDSMKGLWKSSPLISWTLLVSLLSLAGIPPAAGFIGKFNLFLQVIKHGQIWLAFLGMGMGVVSIFYYARVIRTMLKGGHDEENKVIEVSMPLKMVMIVSMAMTIIMGIFPGPFLNWTGWIAQLFIK